MALPTSTNDVTARKLGSVINSLWTKIKSIFAKKENGIYWVNGTTSYPAWAANTAYAVGDNVYTTGDGNCWTCKTAHTSGSSFDSSKWNRISYVALTGTNSDIESLYTGLTIAYKVNVCGGESNSSGSNYTTTLNLNGLGAKHVYRATGEFYRWTANKNAVVLLTYDGSGWRMSDYDSNDQYVVPDAYCSTAAGTAAKAATSVSFSYSRHNNIGFRIYFTNTNTSQGQLTLNVNGQGAKNLWINGANSSSSNYTINAGIYWCYYDGTQFQLWTDKSFQATKYRGDGSNLTETFTAASSRSNIATGESNATIFGKIAKWFSDLGTAAFKNVPSSGNAGTSEVVLGSDTRLSDARTPTSHTHGNIANGGTLTDTAAAAAGNDYVVIRDADNAKIQTSTIKGADVADAVSKKHSHSTLTLSTTAQAYDGTNTLALPSSDPYTSARTPTSHTHGNIANGGTLTDTAAAAAGNDYVVIRDADNSKIQTSTIKGTDVADAVSKKHSHSTLTLSTTAQAYDGTHTLALPSTDPYTSARTPSSHTHGNISNSGTLTDTAAAAAGNDYVVIRDADNANVQTSTIKGTDVADAVSKKHSHSTLTLSTTAQAYDGTHTLALPSTDPYTSARTPSSHTHGNITNGGALQTNDITIASGDKLVVTDSSDSSKVARASISFDGSTTTKALTQKGTWETFNNYSLPLAANGTRGGIQIGYSESGTNYAVKLSSEKAYVTVPWTDTKQNITLATTTKAFITGVSTTPTGTAQALTGLADTGVYLTTTAGELNATQYKVNEHCTMKYNSTKSSLDFTFS